MRRVDRGRSPATRLPVNCCGWAALHHSTFVAPPVAAGAAGIPKSRERVRKSLRVRPPNHATREACIAASVLSLAMKQSATRCWELSDTRESNHDLGHRRDVEFRPRGQTRHRARSEAGSEARRSPKPEPVRRLNSNDRRKRAASRTRPRRRRQPPFVFERRVTLCGKKRVLLAVGDVGQVQRYRRRADRLR